MSSEGRPTAASQDSRTDYSNGWGPPHMRYSVDIQPSPPPPRQVYSIDIQRTPTQSVPSRHGHQSSSSFGDTAYYSPDMSHDPIGSYGKYHMQKYYSYSSLDHRQDHHKHARHMTSPDQFSSQTLPHPHSSHHHTSHHHTSDGTRPENPNNRGSRGVGNATYYHSSSQSSQPDPYEMRRSGDLGVESVVTLTPSSQASYDGRGGTQRRLSPWETSSAYSSQDSTQSSDTSHYRPRPTGRPSSGGRSRKIVAARPITRRAMTPNPSAMMNRGEAWELEEDVDGPSVTGQQRFTTQVTTVGHMDQALLPQKLYFPASSSQPHSSQPPHPHSSHSSHAQSSQPTYNSQPYTGAQLPFGEQNTVPPAPQRRHSISKLPTSPSHHEPPVSPVYRHDNRPVVSPTHLNMQRRGSHASIDSSRRNSYVSVDSNVSSESYQSGSSVTSPMRRSPSLPFKPDHTKSSPNISGMGGNRRVSVVDQQVVAPGHMTRGPDHMIKVPYHLTRAPDQMNDHVTRVPERGRRHSTSETVTRNRRRHQYEHVRAPHQYEAVRPPHSYEDMEEAHPPILTPSQGSQQSQEEPTRGSSSKQWKHSLTRKENRPKSSPAPKRSLNASDTRLNRLSKKSSGATSSPAPGKRFSAGNVLDEGLMGEEDKMAAMAAKMKNRMSSPEGQLHTQLLNRYFPSAEEKGPQEGENEQSLSGDSDGTPSTKRSNKKKGSVVLHKIKKTFNKKSVKSTGGDGEGSDGSGGGGASSWSKKAAKKKKMRSNSVSNLTDPDEPARLTQSMEQLNDICRTPGGTPTRTPRLTRSSSKTKLTRRGSEPDLEGLPLTTLFRSGSKKNLFQDPAEALFEQIEQGSTEGVQQLLYSSASIDLNLSSTNDDGVLPVDLAAMLNHDEIAKLLLEKGAKDSAKFCRDPFSRFSRIASLLSESERELDSLQHELVTQNMRDSSGLKELGRKLRKWEQKSHLLRMMKQNFEQARAPGPPADVSLHVTSNRSLTVTFTEPPETNGAVVTRYKIEWCRSEAFSPIVGEFVMTDLRSMEYAIPDLDKGEAYFVRVSAYNMKGFGQARLANPSSAVPSSWHDEDGSQPRFEGKTDQMFTLSAELSMMLSQSPPISPPAGSGTPSVNRSTKATLKKGISKLFGSNVKFHKSLKSGVYYIASLVYSEHNKVVVTEDYHIPILEVADSDPKLVGPAFAWLSKVACTWEHIRTMCESSDPYTSSPAVQFRNKLLHAVLDLQESLAMPDLGLLHPVPYKDKHGATVFVLVQHLKEPKLPAASSSSFKWSNLPRLTKGKTPLTNTEMEAMPVPDQILVDAQEIIAYHTNSTRELPKGLYLGYLKVRSTVTAMKVICSREYPNVLPYMKIRNNPNISRDEWKWFKSLSSLTPQPLQVPTGPQSLQETLLPKIETFLHNLGIAKEEVDKHQLYKHEAIELNENITFLLLLPPAEHVCTPPGSTDHFAKLPNFVEIPINTFEIMQLYTYQRNFMTKYSMVSARLEVELLTSGPRLREASFSNEDYRKAKKTEEDLKMYQERGDPAWKQMRWFEDAVQKGRDHSDASDSLLSVLTIKEGIERARQAAQQQREADKRREKEGTKRQASLSSGYLRVFPAYSTGLVKGTSVKLYITLTTTTTEVIRLVVYQLEKARLEKAKSEGRVVRNRITEEDMSDFYLVGMTNTKEWTLDTRAYPLSFQASTCRLEVRRKSRMDEHVTTV